MIAQKHLYYLTSIFKLLTGIRPWPRVLRTFLRPGIASMSIVELRTSGLRFKTRGAMDIWSVKETFLDRFYERFGVPLEDGWTVVDIGGGIGEFTIYAAYKYPHTFVYAFEPTPESFALLQENLRLNHISNVKAFPEAIWHQNSTLSIDTNSGDPIQFTIQQAQVSVPVAGKVLVPGIALSEVFSRLRGSHCDLLKMDCEGAEYDILLHTPDDTLARIDRLVMEYHDRMPGRQHAELVNFLSMRGFRVDTYPNFVHPELGYLRALRD